MDVFTILMGVMTIGALCFSFKKDKKKTLEALKKAFYMGRGMAVSIFSVIFAIGFILAIFPPEHLSALVSRQNSWLATVSAALFGTVTLIPAFIVFPLIGTLMRSGLSITPAVAFLTTLTMVGIATFPLEKKQFGLKFALARNGLSFVFAIAIAVLMGVILQ